MGHVHHPLERLALQKQLRQIAARGRDQQLAERLRLSFRRRPMLPQLQQPMRSGIMLRRRLLRQPRPQHTRNQRTQRTPRRQPQVPGRVTARGVPVQQRLGRVQQMALGHDFVHQPQATRLARAHAASGEHEIERRQIADEHGQPERAGEAGMDAEPHLGQSEPRRRVLARDAISTGERQLQPAAETVAVNHRNAGKRQCGKMGERALGGAREFAGLVRVGDFFELAHVGAGDETAGFGRAQNQTTQILRRKLGENLFEFREHFTRQRVRGLPGDVEGQQRLGVGDLDLPMPIACARDGIHRAASIRSYRTTASWCRRLASVRRSHPRALRGAPALRIMPLLPS